MRRRLEFFFMTFFLLFTFFAFGVFLSCFAIRRRRRFRFVGHLSNLCDNTRHYYQQVKTASFLHDISRYPVTRLCEIGEEFKRTW